MKSQDLHSYCKNSLIDYNWIEKKQQQPDNYNGLEEYSKKIPYRRQTYSVLRFGQNVFEFKFEYNSDKSREHELIDLPDKKVVT